MVKNRRVMRSVKVAKQMPGGKEKTVSVVKSESLTKYFMDASLMFQLAEEFLVSKVRDRMEELELTQTEVAKRIGVTSQCVNMFLQGKRGMTATNLVLLLKSLGLEIGTAEPTPAQNEKHKQKTRGQ